MAIQRRRAIVLTAALSLLVPVVTSAVTAMPGDNTTSFPSIFMTDFSTRTRAAANSSALWSGLGVAGFGGSGSRNGIGALPSS